tara:strand:- start:7426 stop:8040 length:615 start_codon:yes stop_codon:yes gene_type:complete
MTAIISILFCLLSGIMTRISLTVAKQKWALTYHSTVVYLLLPVITFTITKVISNNIALSLGMVGALSIVRFRNPVKNPLELSIYFLLITYGIAFSVNIKYGIVLLIVASSLIILLDKIKNLSFVKKNSLFNLSFNEEENNYLLEIVANKKLDKLESNEFLINLIEDKINSKFIYKFGSYDKSIILKLFSELKENADVETTELNF